MTLLQSLPILFYLAVIAVAFWCAARGGAAGPKAWILPAAAGAFFVVFSAITLIQDGLLQFWVNHTTNFAGNQVWFDLIFAVVIGFFLIAPRAKAVGMPLWPWAIAVVATACVALLPMLARVLYLEHHART